MMIKTFFLLFLVVCVVTLHAEIINGDFENGLEKWRLRISKDMGEVKVADDGEGGKCALLHKTGATDGWSVVGISQEVDIEPNAVYDIYFRYRTAQPEKVVGWAFRIFVDQKSREVDENVEELNEIKRSIPWSEKWTPFRWRFETGSQSQTVVISLLATYSAWDVWVDDVELTQAGRSIEAEAFPRKEGIEEVEEKHLSKVKGLLFSDNGLIAIPLQLTKGAWAVKVFGTSDGQDTLWPRAVNVALGSQNKVADIHKHGSTFKGRNALFQIDASGDFDLILTRSPEYAGTVTLDRILLAEHDGPAQVRPLCIETVLTEKGKPRAVIVVSDDAEAQEIAKEIQSAIKERSGAVLRIVNDRLWMKGDYGRDNAIAVGNMLQNKLSERLYCLWYTREDRWYPGQGGWVVRSVHDPWGRGTNVAVLAGSDMEGTRQAGREFLLLLKPGKDISIGYTIKVKMHPDVEEQVAEAVGTPDPEYARKTLGRRGQRSLMSSSSRAGISYMLSGDANRARMFVVYFLEHKRRGDLGGDTHMELWKTLRAWDNIEECPDITDEERLEITNYFLYVLRSGEGVFNSMFLNSLNAYTVRHNHHMLAAMDAYYGGMYFRQYYDLEETDDWFKKARYCFESQEFQDKGQDESGNYEPSTALLPLLPYAYTEPGYRFLSSGTAKRFIDRICMSIDNRFACAGHGDCWNVDFFPLLSLTTGAWYYRDRGYQYIVESRFRTHPNEKNVMQVAPPFRMDGFIKPEQPYDQEGVRVARLNRGHYDLYHGKQGLKWNLSLEETFDKISFRTRFEPDKQYLLLDGIACGSHGHHDANCFIRFTDNDRVWFVDDSYTEGKYLADHTGVLVIRNGIADKMVACARFDAAADFGDVGITRTTLADHSGVDWERNVIWLKEECFIVFDRMKAIKEGNYSFRCMWRTLGKAEMAGNRFITRQEKKTPERKDVLSIINGGDVRAAFTEDREIFAKKWTRYEYAEPVVNIHTQDVSTELAVGQEYTFANMFYAANIEEPHEFNLAKLNNRSVFISGEQAILAGIADGGFEQGGLSLNAGVFVMRAKSIAAVMATSLSLDGRKLFESPLSVDMYLNGAQGMCVVITREASEITIAGKPYSLKPGRNEFKVDAVAGISFSGVLNKAAAAAQQVRTETVDRPKERSTSNVSVLWEYDAGSSVRAMVVDSSEIILGTQDGSGILLDIKGKEKWRVQAKDRINALSTGDLNGDGQKEILMASEDTGVYAVDRTGKELWVFNCPNYPKNRSKMGQARDVLASDLDGDGKAEVIVGANNHYIHVLTPEGKERAKVMITDIKHGETTMIPDNFAVFDLDGDGMKEILAFPALSEFGIGIEWNLKKKAQILHFDRSNIGGKVAGDINGDGKTDAACGTARGGIFYLIQGKNKLSIKKVLSLESPVSAMAMLQRQEGQSLVAVGLEASYLFVLDSTGNAKWKNPTGSAVMDLAFGAVEDKEFLAVGTLSGDVLFFDLTGSIIARFVTGSRVKVVRSLNDRIVIACDNGKVFMVSLEE